MAMMYADLGVASQGSGDAGSDEDECGLHAGFDSKDVFVDSIGKFGSVVSVSSMPLGVNPLFANTMAAASAGVVYVDRAQVMAKLSKVRGFILCFVEPLLNGFGPHTRSLFSLLKLVQMADLDGCVVPFPDYEIKREGKKQTIVGIYEDLSSVAGTSGAVTHPSSGGVVPQFLSMYGDMSRVGFAGSCRVKVQPVEGFCTLFPVDSVLNGNPVKTVFAVTYWVCLPGVDVFSLLDRAVSAQIVADRTYGEMRKDKSDEIFRRREMLNNVWLFEASSLAQFAPQFETRFRTPQASMCDEYSPFNPRNLCSPLLIFEKVHGFLKDHVDVQVHGLPDMNRNKGVDEWLASQAAFKRLFAVSLESVAAYSRALERSLGPKKATGTDETEDNEQLMDVDSPVYFPIGDSAMTVIDAVYVSNVVMWCSNISIVNPWDRISLLHLKNLPLLVALAVEQFLRGSLSRSVSGYGNDPRLGSVSDVLTEPKRVKLYGPTGTKRENLALGGIKLPELVAMERFVSNSRTSDVLSPEVAIGEEWMYMQGVFFMLKDMIDGDEFESDFVSGLGRAVDALLPNYREYLAAASIMYCLPDDRLVYTVYKNHIDVVNRFEASTEGCTSDGVTRQDYERSLRVLSDVGIRVFGSYEAVSEGRFCMYEFLNKFMLMNMVNLLVFLELMVSAVGFYMGTLNESWVWFGYTIQILGGFGHLRQEVSGKYVVVPSKPNSSGVDAVLLKFFKAIYSMVKKVSDVDMKVYRNDLVLDVLQLERATDGANENMARMTVSDKGLKLNSPSPLTYARLTVNTELRNITRSLLERFVTSLPRSRDTSSNVTVSTRDPSKTNDREQMVNVRMDGFLTFFMMLSTNCSGNHETDEPWQSLWTVLMLLPSGASVIDSPKPSKSKKRPRRNGNVFSGETGFLKIKPQFDRCARLFSLSHLGCVVHVALANKLMACRFEVNSFVSGLMSWISGFFKDNLEFLFSQNCKRDHDRLMSVVRSRAVAVTAEKTFLFELTRCSSYGEAVARTYMSMSCNAVEVRDVWQSLHIVATRYIDFRMLAVNQIVASLLGTPRIPFTSLVAFLALPDNLDMAVYKNWPYFDKLRNFVDSMFEKELFVSKIDVVDPGNTIVPYVAPPLDSMSPTFMRKQYDAKADSGNGHCNDKLLALCGKAMFRQWGDSLHNDAGCPEQASVCTNMLIACTSRFSLDFSFFCVGNENWHGVGGLMRKLDIQPSRSRYLYGESEPELGKMMCTYMLRNGVGGVAVHLVQHLLLSAFIGDNRLMSGMSFYASKTLVTTMMQMLPPRVSGMSADLNFFESREASTCRVATYRKGFDGFPGFTPAFKIGNSDVFCYRSVVMSSSGDERAARLLLIPYKRYSVEDWVEFRAVVERSKRLHCVDMRQYPYHLLFDRVMFTPGVLYPLVRNCSHVVDSELEAVEDDIRGFMVLFSEECDEFSGYHYDYSSPSSFVMIMLFREECTEVVRSVEVFPAAMVHDVLAEKLVNPCPVLTRPCAGVVMPGGGRVGVIQSYRVGSDGCVWCAPGALRDGSVSFGSQDDRMVFVDTGLDQSAYFCMDASTLTYRAHAGRRVSESASMEADVQRLSFMYCQDNLLLFGDVVLVAYEAFEEMGFGPERFAPVSFNIDRAERAQFSHFSKFVRAVYEYPRGAIRGDCLYVSVSMRDRSASVGHVNTHFRPSGGSVRAEGGFTMEVFAIPVGYVFDTRGVNLSLMKNVADYLYV